MTDWLARERRLTFGGVAELYEQARPSYPAELVDEVVAYAQLVPGDRVLEVGAGTGKATRLFARYGHEIVALEPAAEMAAVARRTCDEFPSVTIIESDFEQSALPPGAFKLLISAQAWHWIEPEIRYAKARAALQLDGALGVFWNHPDWHRAPIRSVLDAAYGQAAPEFTPSGPMHPMTPAGDLVADWQAEIEAADGFKNPEVRTYTWARRYAADEYVRLLSTHSDHIVLAPDTRERLFDRVASAIDTHGGQLELTYVTRLCLARAA